MLSDLDLSNCEIKPDTTLTVTNHTDYTLTVIPNPNPPSVCICAVSIPQGTFTDRSSNPNLVSNIFTWNHDSVHPSILSISTDVSSNIYIQQALL